MCPDSKGGKLHPELYCQDCRWREVFGPLYSILLDPSWSTQSSFGVPPHSKDIENLD